MIALGPFALDRPVGKGGMGEVWRGLHAAQSVPVAVKVITARRSDDPRVHQAFRNEVRAVARLHHPHIILLVDHGVVDAAASAASEQRLIAGSPYLAMELVSGGTVEESPPADWTELRSLLLAVLDALAHAHARGVIHRDLKPSNILMAAAGDLRGGVRLTDFGIARALDPSVVRDGDRPVSGTPRYMAPEQIAGGPRDEGPWTDLYALGVIAYELATGSRPFGDAEGLALLERHLTAAVPVMTPRYPVPRDLEGWILRLLAKRPANRFERAADAAWALRGLAAEIAGPVRALAHRAAQGGTTTSISHVSSPIWSFGQDATEAAAPGAGERGGPPPWELEPVRPPAPAPAVPVSWRRDDEPSPLRLLGAGLGLYGVRPVPMVGRDGERDRLWLALRDVSETRTTRLIAVHGAAGHGKSRIVEWIAQRAHEVGAAAVLRASHAPIAGAQGGLAGMVAGYLGCAGDSRERAARRCRRFLVEHATAPIEPSEHIALAELALGDEPGAGRQLATPADRYFVLRRMIERLAARRSVLVWLDDVQWGADALAFAQFALDIDRSHPLPLVMIVTVRDEALEDRPVERELLAAVEAQPAAHRLDLRPLPAVDHARLVERLLGLSGPLVDEVVRRTEGNPLFAVQLVGDWVQRGALVVGAAGFELAPGEDAPLPDDIHALWRARVERTLADLPAPAAALEAIERAAALGLDVVGDEWRAACAATGQAVTGAVVDAMVTHRLAHGFAARWSFAHAMLRESLERTAAEAGRRADHHRACAAMLAARYPDTAAVAERIGRHRLAAGDLEAAIGPLLLAAERRRRAHDLPHAHALLEAHERALRDLGAPASDERWGQGWVRRAHAYLAGGRVEAARQLVERAEAAAAEHGWPAVLARALSARARLAFDQGDAETAYRDGRRALELFTGVDDPHGLADCRIHLGMVCMWRWHLDEATEHYAAAYELARRTSDLYHRGAALRGLGNVRACEGDLVAAQAQLERALATFHDGGNRLQHAVCLNDLGEVARLRGDLKGAETLYRQSLALADAIGAPEASTPRFNLGLVLLAEGRYGEARRLLTALAAQLEAGERTLDLLWTEMALTACAAAEADWPSWDLQLGRAEERLSGGIVDSDLAELATRAAQLTRASGDRDRSRRLYLLAASLWERLGQTAQRDECRATAEVV